jgi:hypothetical protein
VGRLAPRSQLHAAAWRPRAAPCPAAHTVWTGGVSRSGRRREAAAPGRAGGLAGYHAARRRRHTSDTLSCWRVIFDIDIVIVTTTCTHKL